MHLPWGLGKDVLASCNSQKEYSTKKVMQQNRSHFKGKAKLRGNKPLIFVSKGIERGYDLLMNLPGHYGRQDIESNRLLI